MKKLIKKNGKKKQENCTVILFNEFLTFLTTVFLKICWNCLRKFYRMTTILSILEKKFGIIKCELTVGNFLVITDHNNYQIAVRSIN